MRCPFCKTEHPAGTPTCPTTHQRLDGLPAEGEIVDGKYKVIEPLGAGGMAVVYRAEHTKIGRTVALKLLLPEFRTNPELVERVEREARAAGTIDHPNVVEIIDLGATEAFGPYIAMEFLRGMDLATYIENKGMRIPPLEAADIVRQVLSALAVAHSKGVIHRDLKPENIFLVEDEGRQRVKVVDFGISKLTATPGLTKLTRVGTVMGTPQYMPAEQAVGAATQDHRIDLYACGVVFYALLTGRLPYEAENINVLISDMLNKPPVPVQFRNPDLDPDLATIVMTSIERAPDARYQTARAMQDAIVVWTKRAAAESEEEPPSFSDSIRMRFPSAPQPVRASKPDVDPIKPASPAWSEDATVLAAAVPSPNETSASTTPLPVSDQGPSPRRKSSRWWIVPVALAVVGGGLFALRRFAPSAWDQGVSRAGLDAWRVEAGDAGATPAGASADAGHASELRASRHAAVHERSGASEREQPTAVASDAGAGETSATTSHAGTTSATPRARTVTRRRTPRTRRRAPGSR